MSLVHETLFRETIWGQGTEAQYAKYKKAIDEMSVIGCFAMTGMFYWYHDNQYV